jgi:hypothetical protein
MKRLLADDVAHIKKWWSFWVGVISVLLLAGIPVVSDHWPDLAPTFVAWFPKNGAQVAPIIGTLLGIAARVISQRAVMDQLRKLFGRQPKEDGDGTQ